MKDLSSRAEALKEKIYSQPLKEFDRRSAAYRDEKESLGDYVRYLAGIPLHSGEGGPKGRVRGKEFPNLTLLVQALDAENNLDFHKVEQERLKLVEQLARLLPRPKRLTAALIVDSRWGRARSSLSRVNFSEAPPE